MFCNETGGSTDAFKVPHIAVHDGGVYMNKLENKEAVGPDYEFHNVKTRSSLRCRIFDIHLQLIHAFSKIYFPRL